VARSWLEKRRTEGYADVIGRLLVRVYEIHQRVLSKGGGLESIRDAAMLHAAPSEVYEDETGFDLPL
jgi:hypothetical protein